MKSQLFFLTTKALLIVSALACAHSVAIASTVDDEIQVGMEAYQQHDYQTALKYLTAGEHAEPQNALIHYYRANTLTSLHQVKSALPEYQKAYQLSPNSEVGFYSEQALKNSTDGVAQRPLNGSASQTTQSSPNMAFWTPSSSVNQAAAGISSTASSPSAGVQIMEQSRSLDRQVVDQGATNEANIMANGNFQASQLRSVMMTQLRRMQNAMVPSMDGTGTMVHVYSQADMQRYSQQMQAKITAEEINSNYEARNQHLALQQKAEAINQAAASLQSQLNAPYVPGQSHLSAVGTNLYVRSYDSVPSSNAVPVESPPPDYAPAPIQGEHAQALSLSTLQAQDRATMSPQHRLTTN